MTETGIAHQVVIAKHSFNTYRKISAHPSVPYNSLAWTDHCGDCYNLQLDKG